MKLRLSFAILLFSVWRVDAVCHADDWERWPITQDTWLSGVGSEANGSNGGAPRLKLKSIQELSIIDFDPSKLVGREVLSAKLLLKVAGDEPIERVTVSTITSDWVAGNGTGYQVLEGVSTFAHRVHPKERWRGSDITAVCIGHGGSFYASHDAIPAKEDGWVQVEVPEKVLRARLMELSHGIVLMDDTGSTWKRDGEKFDFKLFPNRYVYSIDSNKASVPYLLVKLGKSFAATDAAKLSVPMRLAFRTADRNSPWRRLQWHMPTNELSDLLGFRVMINGRAIPPTEVPSWSNHRNGLFEMNLEHWLRDRTVAVPATVEVVALDRWGRSTPPAQLTINEIPSEEIHLPRIESPMKLKPSTNATRWSGCVEAFGSRWSILDPLDLWLPASERVIPAQAEDYFERNHLWNAKNRQITLHAARGAWFGFQLASQRPVQEIACRFEWDDALEKIAGLRTECSRYGMVPGETEPLPDPLILLSRGRNRVDWILDRGDPTHASQSWLVESYIPRGASAGNYRGKLVMARGSEQVEFDVVLRVHDVEIPDRLSFLPEMNCYNLPANDIDYYRLAHRHRVVLNRLPYFQNGRLATDRCPEWREGRMQWQAYDDHYEDVFSGKAFADLPRGAVPVECFYLPIHENWPSAMEGNYNGDYWADRAFPESYYNSLVSAVEQCADHFQSKGWHETRFQVYFNNKVDFKKKGWSRGSSPWLLDEPANFQDFWALRYFARATKEGRLRSSQKSPNYAVQLLFRGDISRPQWQRDTLDGFMDYGVISFSSFQEYRSMVLERKFRDAQSVVVYGSNNPIGTGNGMAVAWSWDAWCQGADGIVPWQTMGNEESWSHADELALFYPPHDGSPKEPIPSVRLKAYCYGQQDIELLTQLASKAGVSRYALGDWFRPQWKRELTSRVDESYEEPAAWNEYSGIEAERMHQFRMSWFAMLEGP